MNHDVIHAECLTALRAMPDNSVDAIVTDPPYGLTNTSPVHVTNAIVRWATGNREYTPQGKGFMGQGWDAFVPPPAVWDECLRVLKPGGHLVAFAGSRTQDLMGISIRLAGFDIRENVAWMYGSGFPKSHDIGKAIDKAAGAERKVIGKTRKGMVPGTSTLVGNYQQREDADITAPATPEAEKWQGWGTALKPAHEPIILARKPFQGTVAANTLEWGTGGLNIDATRIAHGADVDLTRQQVNFDRMGYMGTEAKTDGVATYKPDGRWPANVVLDPDTAAALDQQSGNRKSGGSTHERSHAHNGIYGPPSGERQTRREPDEGGASRFFKVAEPDVPFLYAAKAPKRERPSYVDADGNTVNHPTVKPVSVISWLVRLVCAPGGTVLDPFAGTGTTGEACEREGMNSILIERWDPYIPLIHQRLDRAKPTGTTGTTETMF